MPPSAAIDCVVGVRPMSTAAPAFCYYADMAKTKPSFIKNNAKQLQLVALLISILLNIVLSLKLIPIDTLATGCSNAEIRLSLLSADNRGRMQQAKINAKKAQHDRTPRADLPRGFAEGAQPCSGVVYRLYIL